VNRALNRYLLATLQALTGEKWVIVDKSYSNKGFGRSCFESERSSLCVFQLGQIAEYFVVPITTNKKLALHSIQKIELDHHNQVVNVLKKALKK